MTDRVNQGNQPELSEDWRELFPHEISDEEQPFSLVLSYYSLYSSRLSFLLLHIFN